MNSGEIEIKSLPKLLTPKDIQIYLGISQDQVYRLFKSKTFPAEKSGRGKYIIPKARFLKWLGVSEVKGS